jgi:hypothetical protein
MASFVEPVQRRIEKYYKVVVYTSTFILEILKTMQLMVPPS